MVDCKICVHFDDGFCISSNEALSEEDIEHGHCGGFETSEELMTSEDKTYLLSKKMKQEYWRINDGSSG